MAITNAQQYQQLVNKPANGKRPGYAGPAGGATIGSGSAQSGSPASSGGSKTGPSSNNDKGGSDYGQFQRAVNRTKNNPTTTTPSGNNNDGVDVGFQEALRKQKIEKKKKEARDDGGFRTTGSQVYSPPTTFQKFKNDRIQNAINRNKYLALQKTSLIPGGGFKGFIGSTIDGLFGKVPENLQDLSEEELTELAFEVQKFKDAGGPVNQATYNYNLNPTKKGSGLELLGRTFDAQDILDSGKMTQTKFEELFPGPTLPKDDGGRDSNNQTDPCLGPNPPAYCAVNNDPTDPATPDRNLGGLAPRFAGSIFDFTGLADGGRAGAMDGGRMMMMANQEEDDPTGGIMDLESGRQMYFLGKLVKKASKAIKKVVKSPIGKAALMYFGGNALMGAGGGKGLSSFFGKGSFNPLKALITTTGQDGAASGLGLSKLGMIANKFGLATGEGALTGLGKGALIGLPSILPLLMGQKEDDDKFNIDDYYKTNKLNIADIRNNPYNYLSSANQGSMYAANGGLMRTGYAEGSEEPVAKKTMPLLDMDGQEMDLREEGGFVPLGRMERADDVPARLSKNEFVFTADAVRNAGEGDVDKGAEVMYNMMKNLESGGEVSEESQGLDGAREMFQTSQRLEEVL